VQKFEQRIAELELELDLEMRKHEDVTKVTRKYDRRVKELQTLIEEESKGKTTLQDTIDKLQQKMKIYVRQVEEAVSRPISCKSNFSCYY